MSTAATTIHTVTPTRHTEHPVHLDPIDQAIAFLVASDLAGELVCDGSCGGSVGPASCSLAPVDGLPTAA